MPTWNSLVQSASINGAGTSLSKAFPGAVTQGNLLVAYVLVSGSTPTSVSVSDLSGNTWAQAVASAKVGNTFVAIWYAVSAGNNTPTVKATPAPASSPNMALAIAEFNPGATPTSFTITLDQTASATGAGTQNPSCGNINVTGTNELAVAMFGTNSGGVVTPTAGTNFTLDQFVSTAPFLANEYDLNVNSAQAGAFTESTATTWGAAGASFIASSGGTTFNVTASDNIALTNAGNFFRVANAFRLTSDNLAITDAVARLANAFRKVSDNVAITDTTQRIANALRKLSDNIAITDTATLVKHGAGVWTIAVADNIGVTDSFLRLANANRSLADNIALSDTIARQVAYLRKLADNLAIADLASTSVNRSALTIQVSDNLAVSDTVKRAVISLRFLADNLAATDLFVSQASYGRLVTDNLAATDTVQRLANAFRAIADNLGVTDAAIVTAIRAVVLKRILNVKGGTNPPINVTGSI